MGALALTLLSALLGTLGTVRLLPGLTWWHANRGLASAFYVCSTIVLFARLGAVVSVGLFIAGQMLASLLLDGFGLLGVVREQIGLWSALGAGGGRGSGDDSVPRPKRAWRRRRVGRTG